MDLKVFLGIAHIIGVAIGLGGATVSDIFFIRIVRKNKLTKDDFTNLQVLSRIIWVGILLLIVSGLAFLWNMHRTTGEIGILHSDKFLAKLTLVAIVTINGVVFRFVVFPKLKAISQGKESLKDHTKLFAVTGAISIVSWYGITIVAMLRGIRWPYGIWMGLYIVTVFIAAIVAAFVIKKLLNQQLGADQTSTKR